MQSYPERCLRGLLRHWLRPIVRLLPDLRVTKHVPQLGKFQFSLRRHRWMLSRRCFDGHQETFETFRRLIQPGDVVYDIGANIGYYVRYIARHFPVSRIVAFEPMSDNLAILARNVSLGGHQTIVSIMPMGLADSDGQEILQIDDMMDGSAALDRVTHGQAAIGRRSLGLGPKTERVMVKRLDQVIQDAGLAPPDFMKIDVEGAEVLVLLGALETLRAHHPRLAVATHSPRLARQVIRTLIDGGYACGGWVKANSSRVYCSLIEDDAENLADNNIVAVDRKDSSLLGVA